MRASGGRCVKAGAGTFRSAELRLALPDKTGGYPRCLWILAGTAIDAGQKQKKIADGRELHQREDDSMDRHDTPAARGSDDSCGYTPEMSVGDCILHPMKKAGPSETVPPALLLGFLLFLLVLALNLETEIFVRVPIRVLPQPI